MFSTIAKFGVAGLAIYGVVAIVEKFDLIPKTVAFVDELLTGLASGAEDPTTDDTGDDGQLAGDMGGAGAAWAAQR